MGFQPRYEPGRYRDCRFCGGRGCPGCDAEADKAYKRAFPNGPQPIATFNTKDAADLEALKSCLHRTVLEEAFSDGGGGIATIIEKLKAAGKYQGD